MLKQLTALSLALTCGIASANSVTQDQNDVPAEGTVTVVPTAGRVELNKTLNFNLGAVQVVPYVGVFGDLCENTRFGVAAGAKAGISYHGLTPFIFDSYEFTQKEVVSVGGVGVDYRLQDNVSAEVKLGKVLKGEKLQDGLYTRAGIVVEF